MIEKVAAKDDAGKRFDVVARAAFPSLGLSEIFKSIRVGILKLNGKKTKGNMRICAGDVLQYYGPYEDNAESGQRIDILGIDIDIPVIWENDDLLALNKPAGLRVHDGPESLQAWVWSRLGKNHALSFRPGPCHRLDRNTSGVIVFAKSTQGARQFAQRQKEDKLHKVYLGLLQGSLSQETMWASYLTYENGRAYEEKNGAHAITYVKPLRQYKGKSLALFCLQTGRTHQIRAQAALAGCPLSGDAKYAGGQGKYHLHALLLKDTNQEPLFPELWAYLPDELADILLHFQLHISDVKKMAKQWQPCGA